MDISYRCHCVLNIVCFAVSWVKLYCKCQNNYNEVGACVVYKCNWRRQVDSSVYGVLYMYTQDV